MKDEIIIKKSSEMPVDIYDTTFQMEHVLRHASVTKKQQQNIEIMNILQINMQTMRAEILFDEMLHSLLSRKLARQCVFIRNFQNIMSQVSVTELLHAVNGYEEVYIFFGHSKFRKEKTDYKNYQEFYSDVEKKIVFDPFYNDRKFITRMNIEECYNKIVG